MITMKINIESRRNWMSWIDLHMHSNISSDGQFTPSELMHLCAENDVQVAALADHNSIRGVAEAANQARKENLEFIPGVELDCIFNEVSLHVLGLDIDSTQPFFSEIDRFMTQQEQYLSQKFIEQVEKLGIYLDHTELWKNAIHGIVTPEVIAEFALAHPNNADNPILKDYRKGEKFGDNPFVNFYWNVCAPGKPAHVPSKLISLYEAIEGIKNAGGIPILAHPGNNIGVNKELALDIIKAGLMGFEVFSSYHTPEQTAFYQALANEQNVWMTVGSDFHGKTKPQVRLGGVSCNDQEDQIYQQFKTARNHQ
jgi:predicted metal-dependent phosphoesterase TrpH